MMVVGFLGCCGAIKESPCMLGLVCFFWGGVLVKIKQSKNTEIPTLFLHTQFFIFLLLIFAVEVAAGTWGLSNKDRVQTHTHTNKNKQAFLRQTFFLMRTERLEITFLTTVADEAS